MKRTALAILLLLILTGLSGAATELETAVRPNIVWILGEDMGPELGFLGTPEVHTPHLDGLAGRGMVFTHAFTTSPVCSPSRSAFNTGMYQTTIGAHNHRSHRAEDPSPYPFPLPEGVQIVSDWLRSSDHNPPALNNPSGSSCRRKRPRRV